MPRPLPRSKCRRAPASWRWRRRPRPRRHPPRLLRPHQRPQPTHPLPRPRKPPSRTPRLLHNWRPRQRLLLRQHQRRLPSRGAGSLSASWLPTRQGTCGMSRSSRTRALKTSRPSWRWSSTCPLRGSCSCSRASPSPTPSGSTLRASRTTTCCSCRSGPRRGLSPPGLRRRGRRLGLGERCHLVGSLGICSGTLGQEGQRGLLRTLSRGSWGRRTRSCRWRRSTPTSSGS
mmetsp:Transcript_4891/g.12366  ORF Transcript_4891/g.12366 Transcript_4891/m.12366 type:complete len:230 (+) Transcript_4891:43-732(+)